MSNIGRLRIAFVADTLHSASGRGILSGEYVVNRLRRDQDVVSVGADGDDALPSVQLPFRAMRESIFVMARPDRRVLATEFAGVDLVARHRFNFDASVDRMVEAYRSIIASHGHRAIAAQTRAASRIDGRSRSRSPHDTVHSSSTFCIGPSLAHGDELPAPADGAE
jgi:hypothetical protein